MKFDFDIGDRRDFDVAATTAAPFVRTPRCWACEGRLGLEGGYVWDESGRGPYIAAEASLAVLSPNLRAVGRTELSPVGTRFQSGIRWAF
jgi:hypothetical protein